MKLLKLSFVFAIMAALSGCVDIATNNSVGDTAAGRAAIMNFVQPGTTTIEQVEARFGKPVAIQGLGDGNFQANFSSYFGTSGYAGVKYNDRSRVVFGAEAYSYDTTTQKFTLESRK